MLVNIQNKLVNFSELFTRLCVLLELCFRLAFRIVLTENLYDRLQNFLARFEDALINDLSLSVTGGY